MSSMAIILCPVPPATSFLETFRQGGRPPGATGGPCIIGMAPCREGLLPNEDIQFYSFSLINIETIVNMYIFTKLFQYYGSALYAC